MTKLNTNPITIRTHNNFKMPNTKLNNQPQAMTLLKEGIKIIQSCGLKCWVGAGTLLGLYRDGKFIQHDMDLDIEIALETYAPDNQQKITEMTKQLEHAGYLLGRTIHEGDTPHQLAFYHPRHNDLIFDVSFYYNAGDNQRYVCNHDLGNLVLHKTHFEELTTFMDLPCPKDIEGHITYRYGTNWKTPIKGAHHTWLSGTGVLR